ncbi:MAG: ABC transporter substrate-binding protein [Vreelandella alkaliphila]|uniref:Amino acid ABC transporter substrate-binding protein n=1 Tax=Halomonas campaniensis TaxID=213554 RepID=A0A3D0KJN2_9GAMM|nr:MULTISPECIES: ABC transporter substrate-binding protein [unclassified Halomonas]HBP40615.1 amino acid ABC transporter substrate-binding protein [Halomonas sp.]HBS83552.1 amino acid ABC transporter substrate-binding protein [Halomonas campaniensis]ASK20912.1 amino acid ABC transporter substrate-binding protein [Halomonas sp. N3-2A]UTD57137.1 ABC transporter substrate-binding protein [Halomonas sp. MS1]HCA03565.1 amino acid ABC transporter substrate-binding protein [Halomonas campaniensis]
MINKRTLATAVAASSLALAGMAQAEVKVGFLGGFTGGIESLTPPIFAGAQLAVAQINEQGGILGGQTLEMPSGDTTCSDASAASNAADRMVNSEQVTAIVGALCTGATVAAANNAAVPGGVLMVSPASTAPAVSELDDNDLVFRTVPSDAFQGEMLAKLLLDKGIDFVAVTYVNNDYGRGLSDAFSGAFEAGGGEIAENLAHEDNRADYRSELGSLSSSGADTLVVLAYADTSGQTVLRQAYESGMFTQYVGADGMVGDSLIEAIGADVLDGMIATRPGSPDLPGTDIFNEAATAADIDPSAVFAAQAYDAAFLVALAIEQNGSAEREGLSEALRSVSSAPGEVILPGEWEKALELIAAGTEINYEGASGSHEFDENGDVPGVVVEMVVEDGSFTGKGLVDL